jgi:hypothetical protein
VNRRSDKGASSEHACVAYGDRPYRRRSSFSRSVARGHWHEITAGVVGDHKGHKLTDGAMAALDKHSQLDIARKRDEPPHYLGFRDGKLIAGMRSWP